MSLSAKVTFFGKDKGDVWIPLWLDIVLHHSVQTNDSALIEMTQTFHQQYTKTIHINPNSIPSGIDREEFNKFRREYWINRAKDFMN